MLFGHQNDANQTSAPSTAPSMVASQDTVAAGLNPLAVDPATGVSLPASSTDVVASVDTSQEESSVLDQPSAPESDTSSLAFASDPAPTTPFGSDQAPTPTTATVSQLDPTVVTSTPVAADTTQTDMTTPQPTTMAQLRLSGTPSDSPSPASDDLLSIKQQALSQLGPLVSQLEQDPEEKFRTTMMLIQSTDNPSLLKDAYAAAQAIPDEKARAQALLDIVNEINYFTQQQPSMSTQTQQSTM